MVEPSPQPADTLSRQLARWQAVGLVDAAQAAAITEFEASGGRASMAAGVALAADLAPAAAAAPVIPMESRPTGTELLAYLGIVLVALAVYTQLYSYQNTLGLVGRVTILMAVAAVGLAAAVLAVRGGRAAVRARAASVGLVVAIANVAAAVGDLLTTSGALARTGSGDTGTDQVGVVLAVAALTAVLALAALLWVPTAWLAIGLAGSVFVTAFALVGYLSTPCPSPFALDGYPGTPCVSPDPYLFVIAAALGGLILLGLARFPRLVRSTHHEFLRFAGAVVPLVVSLLVASDQRWWLQVVAGGFAVVLLIGSLQVRSVGLAAAGGLGLFGLAVDLDGRYAPSSWPQSFPILADGVALLVVAAVLHRVLRLIVRRVAAIPAQPTGHDLSEA